jgi:hypothetical protein
MVVAAVAVGSVTMWLAWPSDDATRPVAAPVVVADTPAPPPPTTAPPAGTSMAFFSAQPTAPAQQPVSAAESMANTRLHGDPEAPPIVRSTATAERPSEQELADPKAYLAYEARQSVRLYANYVRAVDKELPILRDDIARGRAIGIAPEKIAKAEEKARRLEAMRAQLLKDHPELVR